ncbi:MAG: protein kinase domain-containing protein [Planctomycetota bacterium]|jgi:serine/threonine-protein kinase
MTDPQPGAPNDDTRSLPAGGAAGEYADGGESWADGLSVEEWQAPEQLGPYRIVRELGRGGMAAVFLATHVDDGREVALKVMTAADDAAGRELQARFAREGEAAQRLGDHPNVVTVYEVGRDGRTCWMAMALVSGSGLDGLVDAGDLSFEQAAYIIERVALAVEHAHAGGVLHRDIKPSNILVQPNGTPLLADFGLARAYGGSELTRLTASGTVLGTPSYMPPEQAQGETLDARADIYALGATLYELVTGRPPFTSGRLLALLQKVVSEPPPPPRSVNPAVPPRLEWIILQCLAKDPAERYATAAALATDLQRFRTGEAVEAGRGSVWRRLRGLWRRKPLLVGAGLAAAATAILTAGLWGWGAGTQRGAKAALAEAQAETDVLSRETQVTEAYYTLARDTHDAVNRLEDFANGAPLPAAEVDALLGGALEVTRSAADRFPDSGVPLAWEGLLRFYAGDAAAGQAAVERACLEHPDDPFPHLLLGRLELTRYANRISGGTFVFGVGRVDFTPLEEGAEQRAMRERAAAAFAKGLDERRWSGVGRGQEFREFARAAALFAARENAAAAAALDALVDDPQLGRTALALAAAADLYDGRYAPAAARLERLAERGWSVGQILGCYAHLAVALERLGRGEDPTPDCEWVINAAEARRAHRPRSPHPLIDRATARQTIAQWRIAGGADARPLLAQAIADLELALELRPRGEQLMHLAQTRIEAARAERQFGGDPVPHLRRAVEEVEAAVTGSPQIAEWRTARAEARFQLGQELERLGKSPTALYRAAVEDLEGVKATVHDPAAVFHTLGNLYRALGVVAFRGGEDPLPQLDRAIEAYGEVMRLLPGDARPASGRGAAWALRAEFQVHRKQDPERSFANALADFAEAIRRNPKHAAAMQNRAACWAAKGQADAAFGRDPRPAFEASIEGFDRALQLTPGHPVYLAGRGKSWRLLAQAQRRAGDDPQAAMLAAVADLEAADRIRPGGLRTLVDLAETYEALGRWADAVGAYDRALRLRPGHPKLTQRRDDARARAKR